MPDKYLYDCLTPYGRVISVKHLTIKGFPSVQSGTRMVSMVIEKAIPAEIRTMGFQLSFCYRGQPPTCFACQEVGHTARDCPKSQKRRDKGRNPSKPAPAKNTLKEPVKSGSSKSGSTASPSHLRDLREHLDLLKQTFAPSVVSGEDTVSSQPTLPPVVVVEAVLVATSSSPGVRQLEAVASLQQDFFEFSLEVPPADTVVPSSSSGWSQQFNRSVRCKGNDSLEIVVPSSASCLGPNNNNNKKIKNKLTKSTSTHTKAGGTSNNSSKSSKQAKPAAKSLPKLARGVGVKSVRASSSSSASEDEDNIPLRHRSKKLRKASLPPTLSSGMPPSGVAQVLPGPAASPAPAEVMEEDVDACLAGDSVVDPVGEESVPAVAMAEPHAARALMDEDSAPSQAVVVDDNAASQDCPSWPFSSPQSELGSYLDCSLSFLHDDSLGSLFDDHDPGDVSASSTCTSSSDQARADQLQVLLGELPAGTRASDVESPLPQH